jgi:hypothetical protein
VHSVVCLPGCVKLDVVHLSIKLEHFTCPTVRPEETPSIAPRPSEGQFVGRMRLMKLDGVLDVQTSWSELPRRALEFLDSEPDLYHGIQKVLPRYVS